MTLIDRLEALADRLERLANRLERQTIEVTVRTPGETLDADELRFQLHLAEHGCARDGRGFAYCDEAMALFRKLPPERQALGG